MRRRDTQRRQGGKAHTYMNLTSISSSPTTNSLSLFTRRRLRRESGVHIVCGDRSAAAGDATAGESRLPWRECWDPAP